MRIESPEIVVRFPVSSLVARRSFVFARAGFGKSNLNKLLFSKLYETTPTVEKRGNVAVPVGTIIFDPDGEYFWPDDKGRPGLCDVPHLQDKVVVFTARAAPSEFYGSFTAGGIKLDIRQLRPSDVISIALPPERQDQQNVAKLRALSPTHWSRMVDLIDREKGGADLGEIGKILNLTMPNQEAEAIAARSNMTNVVGMLHDRSSQFMGLLMSALEAGKICVVDVSQMRGAQSFILAGIILRRVFDRNQEEFTKAVPRTIPTIAVIEEAQAVLNERAAGADPYLAWVKEGRKYDLGALLITQQPGSIPHEILSQGDNWFIFHLLSAGDLASAKRANAHFSDDLLSSLLNEPLPGQGVDFFVRPTGPCNAPRTIPLSAAATDSPTPPFNKAVRIKFWSERQLRPPQVDLIDIIGERARRYYGTSPRSVHGTVVEGDSRNPRTLDRACGSTKQIGHVITSPPYYGLNTYLPDQWIRNWFLGGPATVEYTKRGQLSHRGRDEFIADLREVWVNVGRYCKQGAKLVVRFGSIGDRPLEDPARFVVDSLDGTGWSATGVRHADNAANGKRQADTFRRKLANARDEVDVWAQWLS